MHLTQLCMETALIAVLIARWDSLIEESNRMHWRPEAPLVLCVQSCSLQCDTPMDVQFQQPGWGRGRVPSFRMGGQLLQFSAAIPNFPRGGSLLGEIISSAQRH